MSRPAPTSERKPRSAKTPLPRVDWREEHGPFDLIGDVHGCAEELIELLGKLGYRVRLTGKGANRRALAQAPAKRRAIFVGDFVDRGPASPDVLRIVMAMVAGGQALAVIGNHDDKLLRWLKGHAVKLGQGLERTVEQLGPEDDTFRATAQAFLEGLPSYAWLDAGRLVAVHAGIRETMLGRNSAPVRSFCLYGDTSGKF